MKEWIRLSPVSEVKRRSHRSSMARSRTGQLLKAAGGPHGYFRSRPAPDLRIEWASAQRLTHLHRQNRGFMEAPTARSPATVAGCRSRGAADPGGSWRACVKDLREGSK